MSEMVEIQLFTSFTITCPKCKDEGVNYISNPDTKTVHWNIVGELDEETINRFRQAFNASVNSSTNSFRMPVIGDSEEKESNVYWGEICDMP